MTFGGADGNFSPNSIINLKMPPSHSVSSGPIMIASKHIIFSGRGLMRIPKPAASYWYFLKSLIKRRFAAVDIFIIKFEIINYILYLKTNWILALDFQFQ